MFKMFLFNVFFNHSERIGKYGMIILFYFDWRICYNIIFVQNLLNLFITVTMLLSVAKYYLDVCKSLYNLVCQPTFM